MEFQLFPDQASSVAGWVDGLFLFQMLVTIVITALVFFLVVYFAVKYRKGSRANRSNPVTHNTKLEVTMICVPFVLGMIMFVWGAYAFLIMYDPPGDATRVDVVAKQWMWKLQHPEGKREINELHVPLGRPVRLVMESQDVIHSFYVPAFRTKQDVLPGRQTELWFKPTKTGKFHLYCAEYCGTDHSVMGGWVYVMEPAEYEDWLSRNNANEPMAVAGARLFEKYQCSGCHGPRGTNEGPPLEGVYGGQVAIKQADESSRFVRADDRYIHDSIRLPASQVVAGYKPIMPVFSPDILPEDDLFQIIAYIKSIGRKGATVR